MEKHVFFWLSIFYIYMLTGQLLLATGKRKKFSTHVDRDVIYTKNNVIKKDGCGWTPLHRATVSGNVNEVKQLFEIKPDLNAMTAKYKVTPLHLAVSISNKDIVQMFLDKNVDVNIGDSDGRTPLHWAACRGYKDIVQMLLKYGANVNTVDTDGRTPLHCAEKNGKVADLLGKAEKYYSQIKKCMLSGKESEIGSLYKNKDLLSYIAAIVKVKKIEKLDDLYLALFSLALTFGEDGSPVAYFDHFGVNMMVQFYVNMIKKDNGTQQQSNNVDDTQKKLAKIWKKYRKHHKKASPFAGRAFRVLCPAANFLKKKFIPEITANMLRYL